MLPIPAAGNAAEVFGHACRLAVSAQRDKVNHRKSKSYFCLPDDCFLLATENLPCTGDILQQQEVPRVGRECFSLFPGAEVAGLPAIVRADIVIKSAGYAG